jgi:ADP-ribose pyrophosphatase
MKPKIIKREIIWDGKFLQGVKIIYSDFEGTERAWESVERKNPDIVSVVLYDNNKDEFIPIEQFRPPVAVRVIELVAGVCDVAGEPEEIAARREAAEESGWDPQTVLLISARDPVSSGMQNEMLTSYFGTDLKLVGKKQGHEENGIIVHSVPRGKIFQWLDEQKIRGKMIDAKVKGSIALALLIIAEREKR